MVGVSIVCSTSAVDYCEFLFYELVLAGGDLVTSQLNLKAHWNENAIHSFTGYHT